MPHGASAQPANYMHGSSVPQRLYLLQPNRSDVPCEEILDKVHAATSRSEGDLRLFGVVRW